MNGNHSAVDFTCCGGFWSARRWRKRRHFRRSTVYHDCVMDQPYSGKTGAPINKETHQLQIRSSDLLFVSACQDLSEEMYKCDTTSVCTEEYPIVTTSRPPRAHKRQVSILDPPSLLQQHSDDDLSSQPTLPRRNSLFSSLRRKHTIRRSVLLSKTTKIRPEQRGYPGHLKRKELEECLQLLEILQKDPHSIESQICFKFAHVEDTAQTLCRFLRHVNFSAQRVVQHLRHHAASWQEAAKHDFYPNLPQAMGQHCLRQDTPMPLFLNMYPYVYYGRAKNGCPVSYFQVRHANPEGLQCLTDMEGMKAFLWNSFVYGMAGEWERVQKQSGGAIDTSRACQAIQITDLAGVSRAQCTSPDIAHVVQLAAQIGECFPETVHVMILINAPVWFSAVWRMICTLLPARLTQMIQVYSNASTGQERLRELIEMDQIPSDFGGTGPTLRQCIQQKYNQQDERVAMTTFDFSSLGRRRRTGKLQKDLCELAPGETCSIQVFTRSATGAVISVEQDSTVLIDGCKIERQLPVTTSGTTGKTPSAYCSHVVANVQGPGRIVVELEHDTNETFSSLEKNAPRGYFLVAATILTSTPQMQENVKTS